MEKPDEMEKKALSEEERLELAAKLDAELEDYINNLEKKSYTDGWAEDCWEEEMAKHPFFMKESPKPGDELSPLMEGLQQLKYSPDENTPQELANNYKEDGNFNFKCKKYRLAILSYTEGIKTNCQDDSLRAQLYNNRAAAQFMLKNYRSCLNDCKQALKLQPKYPKAHSRAANCCFFIKNYEDCIDYCNKYLKDFGKSEEVSKLLTNATLERKKSLRDSRLMEKQQKSVEKEEDRLIKAIQLRGIKVENGNEVVDLNDLQPLLPQLLQHRVRLDSNEKLIWPVSILYPEVMQTDFIQNFHEDTRFMDQLEELFEEPPEWDSQQKYTLCNVNVYFEGDNKRSVHRVNVTQTLGMILEDEKFVLRGGTPTFLVLVASSHAEIRFLEHYKSLKNS